MDEQLLRVRQVLATTPARWQALTATIDASVLRLAPAPGEWSALDCLAHLVETEESVFPVRLAAFLAGRDFPGFDPDAAGGKTEVGDPHDLAARFAELRSANLAALEHITGDDLPRTAIHAELGRVTLAEMLNEWAGHDLMHTVQAERALLQPFIEGCGPWESYFEEHRAKVQA